MLANVFGYADRHNSRSINGDFWDQQQINKSEWDDPRNWFGPNWLCVYFSKNDTRTWVPKRIPSMGWTINLGRTAGVIWLTGFIIGIPLLIILIVALTSLEG
jgi:uncharacterized membrane protein